MSGVIVVVIVAMWAALLVPMWLRRHEEADQLGSIDRFSAAMRILSRQDKQAGARSLVVPRRDSVQAAAPLRKPISERPARPAPPLITASRARLIARRRRVMTVLAGLVALTFLLAVFGVLSFWWQGVVDLTLVAYVVHLRAEAIRAAELRAMRAGRETGHAGSGADLSGGVAVSPPAASTLPPLDAEEVFAQPGMDPGWQPTDVPLPTYVTAPVAPRRAVRILDDDLGMEVFVDEDEVQEIVTRRRAVNE
ncbi:MAG: hypothetical protein QOJ92_2714 [Frankiales bacterium]|nr:hypothetical protein [Frankiales bacterium]